MVEIFQSMESVRIRVKHGKIELRGVDVLNGMEDGINWPRVALFGVGAAREA